MKRKRNRLLVALVLATVVSALGWNAAFAGLRPWTAAGSGGTRITSLDRHAAPSSGEPDVGSTGKPSPTTRQLTPQFQRHAPSWLPDGRLWKSWIWAMWMTRGAR